MKRGFVAFQLTCPPGVCLPVSFCSSSRTTTSDMDSHDKLLQEIPKGHVLKHVQQINDKSKPALDPGTLSWIHVACIAGACGGVCQHQPAAHVLPHSIHITSSIWRPAQPCDSGCAPAEVHLKKWDKEGLLKGIETGTQVAVPRNHYTLQCCCR